MRALLLAATALSLPALPAAAQERSAIRQMIEMQLNSRGTEPAPPGVPGLEAWRLVPPPPGAGPQSALPGAAMPLAPTTAPMAAPAAVPARPMP